MKKKKNDKILAFLASLWNGRDMVVYNFFNIYMFILYMFILSRIARWCQYLINSAFLLFFSGVAKNRPYSLYLRLLLVASLLILGYDATALSTLADSGVARHGPLGHMPPWSLMPPFQDWLSP